MRRDVVIVASVSCIYGLGTESYYGMMVQLREAKPKISARCCANCGYSVRPLHGDVGPQAVPRARGLLDIFPPEAHPARGLVRRRSGIYQYVDPVTGNVVEKVEDAPVFPRSHYVASPERLHKAPPAPRRAGLTSQDAP